MPTGNMRSYAVLAGVTAVGIGIANTLNLLHYTSPQGIDFAAYYGAAKALLAHQSPYQPAPTFAGCYPPSPYAYPTLFAYLVMPLTALSCGAAHIAWDWVSVGMLAGVLCLLQAVWPQPMRRFVLLCLAMWACYPLWSGLAMGQIHILILFLMLLALWRIKQGDAWGAGAALALACWIQVLPGLLVVYLMLRRDWRVVRATVIAGACMLALMLLLNAHAALAWPTGLATMHRVDSGEWNRFDVSALNVWGLWLAVPIAVVYLALVRRLSWDAGYVWTIATLLLLAPNAYIFMVLWLFPVAWLALRRSRWQRAGWMVLVALCLVPLALTPIPFLLVATWLSVPTAFFIQQRIRQAPDQGESVINDAISQVLTTGIGGDHV